MSILGMPMFREPCSPLHQGEEQLNTELFLRVVPFITLFVGVVKGKKRIVRRGGEVEKNRSSITGRIVSNILYCSHYFYLDC